jgi:hypothetical protein
MARPKFDELPAMVAYRRKGDIDWRTITDENGAVKVLENRKCLNDELEKLGIEEDFEYKLWLQHEHKKVVPEVKVTLKFVDFEDSEYDEDDTSEEEAQEEIEDEPEPEEEPEEEAVENNPIPEI